MFPTHSVIREGPIINQGLNLPFNPILCSLWGKPSNTYGLQPHGSVPETSNLHSSFYFSIHAKRTPFLVNYVGAITIFFSQKILYEPTIALGQAQEASNFCDQLVYSHWLTTSTFPGSTGTPSFMINHIKSVGITYPPISRLTPF